jgi:Zn finger protein HypA/HybF involved in hydrogenase expression
LSDLAPRHNTQATFGVKVLIDTSRSDDLRQVVEQKTLEGIRKAIGEQISVRNREGTFLLELLDVPNSTVCSGCGSLFTRDTALLSCTNCGRSLEQPQPTPPPKAQDVPTCPKCGHVGVPQGGGVYKCLNCGESLGEVK